MQKLSERQIQRSFMQLIAYERLHDDRFWLVNHYFSGCYDYRVASIMKADGVSKSWPDIQVVIPAGKYHGMFLELKRPGEKARDDQLAMHDRLRAQDYFVAVETDAIEAMDRVRGYLAGRI